MARDPEGVRRQWLVPMGTLAAIAFLAFAAVYSFDHFVTGGTGLRADFADPFSRYVFFDEDHIPDAVSSLGGLVAGVLGIVISVVSIVVQLSAERHPGVTAMFFRDRTNQVVLGFYVVACAIGVFVALSVRADFAPRLTLVGMILSTVLGLVMMAPYFAYVFRFLEPANIIARIEHEALRDVERGAPSPDAAATSRAQGAALRAMAELTDITSNSISGKDKIIASRAVDALKDLGLDYAQIKAQAADPWFRIGPAIRENPDFVAMEPESLADLEARRTWFEWKIMRQYLGIYNEALGSMKDINYLVAIDTRYLGDEAIRRGDAELVALTLRFMNSYLRATLNARDVRTAYNVLNQYRMFVETMLRQGLGGQAVAAVGHMKYYAHVSYDMQLSFVTETVAYDVGALCQLAHELGRRDDEDAILKAFLDVDRPNIERAQEQGLKGVRKAQVKLAAYYLVVGEKTKARLIHEDMAGEPRARLRAIRDELERVETKDFWEIIDRGRNFEYMPPEQKASMRAFFGWFEHLEDPPPSASAP